MENILILGAGLMQRPAIEAASELGYRTVVVDGNPGALCVPLADRFEPVDLKDREALLELAQELKAEEGLAAVFTAGTDFSASVSYVAEKLGLPGHSFQAALNASDKTRMRGCFQKAGVPSPAFFCVTEETAGRTPAQIMEMAGLKSFPLVIKPVDNMGGRGCRMIRTEAEFSQAVADAVSFSRSGRAILEEYMPGREFSIDALVFDGQVTITGFADRHIYFPPYFIEMGHTMSTKASVQEWNSLAATFRDGIKALGLTHGVAKADIKLTPSGPMIGEIAARLSGGYMSGWTYPYASGMNLTKQALLIALGKEPEEVLRTRVPTEVEGVWNVRTVRTSAERAWLSIPGVVESVHGIPEEDDVIKNVLPRTAVGDSITFPVNNVGKCGNIITCSSDCEVAVDRAETASAGIVLKLKDGNPDTEGFLSAPLSTEFPPSAYRLPDDIEEKLMEECTGKVFLPKEGVFIPGSIKPFMDSLKDWNRRTLSQTIELFDRLNEGNCPVKADVFWHSLLRGGIQGALYVAEAKMEDR